MRFAADDARLVDPAALVARRPGASSSAHPRCTGPVAAVRRRTAGWRAARRSIRSPRRRKDRDGSERASFAALRRGTAASAQAMKPFMSDEPRPKSRPSRSVSAKGSLDQGWPSTGTTSVWPDRMAPPATFGPDRRDEVGLGAVLVGNQTAFDAVPGEIAAHVVDQREIGIRTDRAVRDETRQQRDGVGGSLRHAPVSPGARLDCRRSRGTRGASPRCP